MSRVVRTTHASATALSTAVAGAPRATVAVFLVATLAFATLLPQLQLVNSEDMWLPQGPRTDSYHALAASMGSTEFVGVLAESPDGNIVQAADLAELLALEDRAISDPSVAEAFRFPRDPQTNALSLGDVIAEADAVLEHRRQVFDTLALNLNATLTGSNNTFAEGQAVSHAAWTAALLEAIRQREEALRGPVPHDLLAVLLPELEVALLSGTDDAYKARAVELLLAGCDFALWSREAAPFDPQDPALSTLRTALLALSTTLFSNASAPVKSQALLTLALALASAKAAMGFPADAARNSPLLLDLAAGFDPAADPAQEGDYAAAISQLIGAWLAADQQLAIADPEAAQGLAHMAENLSRVLGSDASPATRAKTVEIFRRLFQVVGAMGDRGLDLSVPQSNITFNAYAAALDENASVLRDASAPMVLKQEAASRLAAETVNFIATNQNLNDLLIFTDQASFQRLMTMLYWLNDTFQGLTSVLSDTSNASVTDAAAVMVGAELLEVLNTSAVPPHSINLTAAANVEAALAGLRDAVNGTGPAGAWALSFERAAGRAFASFDFPSTAPLSRTEENLLFDAQRSLEGSAAILRGGDPPPVKQTVAALSRASLQLAGAAPSTALDPAAARSLFTIVDREGLALDRMVQVGQNPALFSRLARATLGVFTDGLASTQGGLVGTDASLVAPFRGSLQPLADVLLANSVSAPAKNLLSIQAFGAAQRIDQHLVLDPSPQLPANRSEASTRITALGDAGVSRTLAVLVGSLQALAVTPSGVDAADPRVQPFLVNMTAYHPGLERELRELLGPTAIRLLPHAYSASGDQVTAEGTVVLFLFNGSLDRATLGARESALRSLAASATSPGVKNSAFGYGLMWYDTQREMDLSVVLFALTMLVVMGAALWAVYRNAFDVMLTVALLGFTVIWVLGTAALLGIAINPVTQVIPVLLIGLAEDYAVHLIVGYRRNRAAAAAPGRASLAAVIGIGGVLLAATVTNGLSFLSFGGSQIALIQDFGTMMALGLFYAFLMTVTFIPAALVWHDRRRDKPAAAKEGPAPVGEPNGLPEEGPTRVERLLTRTVHTSVRHPWTTLLFVALLTAASGLGATTLATTFSYDQITAKDLAVVRTLNFEQDHYSASIQRVFIVVDGQIAEPSVFLEIRNLTERVYLDPYVVRIKDGPGLTSIATFVEDGWRAARTESEGARGASPAFALAFRAADENGDGRLDAADNLTRARLEALYSSLLDDPLSTATELLHRGPSGFDRAAVRIEAVRAVEHGDELTSALEEDAAPLRGLMASDLVSAVTVTGLPLLNREVMEAVQESGWQSVIATVVLAIVILSVFFFVAFRSIALGPLTIAPTLIAVAWTLGAMVVAGLSLNMMTVMIATTTVGMGDLYAIHISFSFYRELRRHRDPIKASDAMVKEAGAPLLEASATTALGFLILVFAPVPVVEQYGLIFAASIVFAFLYSIVVMPVLVLLYARATHQIGAEAPAA